MTRPEIQGFLGSRVKGLRIARGLSLRGLARQAGTAASYLCAIEAGVRVPRGDKVRDLADALGCTVEALSSADADALELAEGPDRLLAALDQVSSGMTGKRRAANRGEIDLSLLRAIADTHRRHSIGVEHLFRAAVRSRLELRGNFDPSIESLADNFRGAFNAHGSDEWQAILRRWLEAHEDMQIDESELNRQNSLDGVRALLTKRSPRLLFLNKHLSEQRKLFVLAREVGYSLLKIGGKRSRVYPPDSENSLDQVLNDYRASYFAAALLVPNERLFADLKRLLTAEVWNRKTFEEMLRSCTELATIETAMYRVSQVLGRFPLRTHFLKVAEREEGVYRLEKHLNLSAVRVPSGINRDEHFCRRWLATRVLQELRENIRTSGSTAPIIDAQISRFPNPDEAFFGMAVAVPGDAMGTLVSFTVGFRLGAGLPKGIKVINDLRIARPDVGGSCERCGFECHQRVAAPRFLDRARQLKTLLEWPSVEGRPRNAE